VPQLEAWQKVFLGDDTFLTSTHGAIGCIECHGGTPGTADMDAAHMGVVQDPAAAGACAFCHSDTTHVQLDSLHMTLSGYYQVLEARSTPALSPQLQEAVDNHCTSCHASCGQCHVSVPTSAGGGLLANHDFKAIPPMNTTCTACHGSRVNDEYKGKNTTTDGMSIPADVHFNPGGMACGGCHDEAEIHGDVSAANDVSMYGGTPNVSCTDCHPLEDLLNTNDQHTQFHLTFLTCQVCHSVDYKNCYSCHVQKSDDGTPYYTTDPSQMQFYIGLNPLKSPDRPESFTVLRHVPIDKDSFGYYGSDLLPNFDAVPTWKYATPHNIQLDTPQNSSCDACHGNAAIFLTADKVAPEELDANKTVIVPFVPSEK
jgi:hypothetical protein